MENIKLKRGNPLALIPIGIFLIFYLVTSIVVNDFYKMPIIVAFLIAAVSALVMNREKSLNEKVDIFCKGSGNPNIMIMVVIFILAGGFAQLAKDIGAVESTVNFGLSILPGNILITGIFIIGCFISISIGTSVGTIVALAPMAVGIADQTAIPVGIAIGAVISGAMFGDNLSMISDTTIAATRTQGCQMKDKFRMNIKIVLPAAIITALIYVFASGSSSAVLHEVGSYNIIKMLPYLFVLIAAASGVNVIIVLVGGIAFSSIVGIATGTLGIFDVASSINKGIIGMSELILISIIIGGILELIKENGGIDYILYIISKNINSTKGAEFGIAILVGLVNICTANNTIAIVMAGPLAKNISDEFGVDPKRSASILDTFSCFFQGIIPYGAQLLIAAGIAGISPMLIMKYLYYPYLMGISAIIVIAFGKSVKNE